MQVSERLRELEEEYKALQSPSPRQAIPVPDTNQNENAEGSGDKDGKKAGGRFLSPHVWLQGGLVFTMIQTSIMPSSSLSLRMSELTGSRFLIGQRLKASFTRSPSVQ